MAPARLSRLQRGIPAWLWAEDQRMRGTMAASHQELVHALAHDKGNLSHSLANLAAKGLITLTKTPQGPNRGDRSHGRRAPDGARLVGGCD